MNHQIITTYTAIGVIYMAVRLIKVKQSKFDKMMNELRCVFKEAPESYHAILSLFTSILFIFMAALGVILWPYYATKRIIKAVKK